MNKLLPSALLLSYSWPNSPSQVAEGVFISQGFAMKKLFPGNRFPKLREAIKLSGWIGKQTLPYVVMILCLLGAPFALIAVLGGISTFLQW